MNWSGKYADKWCCSPIGKNYSSRIPMQMLDGRKGIYKSFK